MIGTRRLTTCTVNSTTRLCSAWLSVADSPVVPHGTIPLVPVHHLDEIHVGAGRFESHVMADLPPESDHLGRRRVMDEIDEVRDACINGVAFQGHPKLTWMGERRQVRPTTPVMRDIQADVQ